MGIISVTAIIAIWSAAKGIQYMADGLNAVHELKRDKKLVCTPILGGYLYHCFLVAIVFTLVVLVFWKQSAAFSGRLSSVYCTSRKKIIIKFRGAYHVTSSDPVF